MRVERGERWDAKSHKRLIRARGHYVVDTSRCLQHLPLSPGDLDDRAGVVIAPLQ